MTLTTDIVESPTAVAPKDEVSITCAHCGLIVPQRLIDPDAATQFCCAGCRAVYETLHACGLQSYYKLRAAAERPARPANPVNGTFAAFDSPTFHRLYVHQRPDGLATADLALDGVSCAACVWLLERLPRVLDGVLESRLSLREATVRITWNPRRLPLSRILRTLDRLGYTPYPARGQSGRDRHRVESRRRLIHLGVAGAIMGNTMLLAFALYAGGHGHMDVPFRTFFRYISAFLAGASLAWPGATFFRSAWAALRLRTVNLDVPIALALAVGGLAGLINVAFNRGEIYFDSLTVLIFLLLVGRFIQYRQQRWAEDAVELLFTLTPSSCRLVRDGEAVEVPVEALSVGDVVEVRAGDIFPADGIVETGRSSANEALLTGESAPIAIVPGSPVHAGAQNIGGVLRVGVSKVGHDTRVGQLMNLIERGLQEKPAILQFADKVSRWFVIVVALASAAVFAFWLRRAGLSTGIDHAVALLIVTCPCVLGLATPLTITIAIGRLARRDIFVKSAAALERLAHAGWLVLDKTGTLTEGRMQLLEWFGDPMMKGVVARIERKSNHPVGRALAEALVDLESTANCGLAVHETIELGDGGISADVTGQSIHVGSPTFIARHGIAVPTSFRAVIATIEEKGATAVAVACNGRVTAVAALGDRLRPDTCNALARLRKMGWNPMILSGDADGVVQSIAREAAIDASQAFGRHSPEDKLSFVRRREDRRTVVMVGDGVNDAAALCGADVGIAVHGGAEASLAAADIYIACPGMAGLVELMELSRRTMRTIHFNLAISLAYNVLAGVLAAAGIMSPLIAAIIMPVSSATVLLFAFASIGRVGHPDNQSEISTTAIATAPTGGV